MSTTSNLKVILGVQGVEQVIADANKAKTALNSSLGDVATSSNKATAGLNKVTMATHQMAAQSLGAQGPIGQMASGLLMAFGPQSMVVAAVLAGMALIVSSIKAQTQASKDATEATKKHRDSLLELAVLRGEISAEDAEVEKAAAARSTAQSKRDNYIQFHPGGFDPTSAHGYNKELARLEREVVATQDAYDRAEQIAKNARERELERIRAFNDKREEDTKKTNNQLEQVEQSRHAADLNRLHNLEVARITSINNVRAIQFESDKAYLAAQEQMIQAQEALSVAAGFMSPNQARYNQLSRELQKAEQLLAVMQQLNSIGLVSDTDVQTQQANVGAARANRDASQYEDKGELSDALTEAQLQHLTDITQYVNIAADAWGGYWDAVFSGQNIFGSLVKAAAAALAKMAALEAGKNIAEGVGNLAKSAASYAAFNIPGGMLFAAAAKMNFLAAAKWAVIGAGSAAIGASVGGGGGGSAGQARSSVNNTMNNTSRPETSITIIGDRYLDTTNPEKMDAFVRAIREAGQGNIIIRGA